MNGKQLKNSILQWAIQGRLVPQDPNDEPASVLLRRIQAEKAKLVKEGKLKKSALSDSHIFRGEDNKFYEKVGKTITCIDEDIPFEIPETWEWVRLGNVCQLMDGERRTGKALCIDAKYLRGKSAGTYMNEGKFVRKGDNIILVDGENSGEVFSAPTDGYMGSTFKQLWLCPHAHLPYMLLFILFNKQNLRDNKRGAAIPHLRKELFFNLLLPLPPLAEQRRIVAKVEEVFAVLDRLACK